MIQVAKKKKKVVYLHIFENVQFVFEKKNQWGLRIYWLLIQYFYGKRNSEIDLIAWMFHETLSISSIISEIRQKRIVQTYCFGCVRLVSFIILLSFWREKFILKGFYWLEADLAFKVTNQDQDHSQLLASLSKNNLYQICHVISLIA